MCDADERAAQVSSRRGWLAAEFVALFVAVPLLAAGLGPSMRRWVIPQIWALAALLLMAAWRDASFERARLRSLPPDWRRQVGLILAVWLLGGILLLAAAAWSGKVELFAFPRRRPALWLLVLVLYPLVSAVAQEFIFRVFVFHRYRKLFRSTTPMVLASATAFALAHLQLGNAVAPLLSMAGGLRFARNYAKSRSLPLVALEHGLWGDWIFTLGLGAYFYGGHA